MSTLIIHHIEDSDPPQFQVLGPDGQATTPASVTPAIGYPVEGRPNSELMAELRWYLEKFLEYPFDPETDHADRVLQALRGWAEAAFNILFGYGDGARLFKRAMKDGVDQLRLQVESDDPRVLSWPWETLHRPGAGPLGQLCQVERRVKGLEKLPPFTAELPRDRVNILLVTARPYEADVGYRSISRPLIDLVEKEELPVDVHILRPPTFERLREHLEERPRHYHILHFDGHGGYGRRTVASTDQHGAAFEAVSMDAHQLEGVEGCLVFEDKIGADAPVSAQNLSSLLSEHEVPVVVLNACQSAMLDGTAETPFASVAASLLQSGTRSVVAMAYSLYVSAAQEFLPDFYRSLFESGDVAEGVRAGRVRLAEERGRVCVRGRFDLEDWLVPVLYQQEDIDLSFAAEAPEVARTPEPKVVGMDSEPDAHAFVGRDGAILQLERATRLAPAAILIHGLGGVGKTTLARGFVEWLGKTEGLGMGCFWISFQEVRSAEYVWNRMGEQLFGSQFAVLDAEQKILGLAQALREHRFLIVWDNFEVVAGIAGASMHPTLSEEDRSQLRRFLEELRGGQTKVLITSRSEESWLGPERQIVRLSGLRGEEQWIYCEEIVKDLKVDVDREDRSLKDLMDLLGGHPLSMRVILSELGSRAAKELIVALQSNIEEVSGDVDGAVSRLYATLGFAAEGLAARLRPLLVPLALHERFVDGNFLEAMAGQIEPAPSRAEIDSFLRTLAAAGLLRELGQAIFEMHPALTGFLRPTVLRRADVDIRDRWTRTYVDFFGSMADSLAPRPFHEQRFAVHLHSANFIAAVDAAGRLKMAERRGVLLQALAVFAQNQSRFAEARDYYQMYANCEIERGAEDRAAAPYHQLGIIAEERRDFAAAEKWYQKSLEIEEKLGNEHGAAITYHQLGIIAEKRRDFAAAEKWYQKSLEINEKLGNEHGAATTYHQLGIIAGERRDFAAAEKWYQKSLEIKEKLGSEQGAATTYHQLGRIAEERRDFAAAEKWYQKSLEIKEKLGNEHGAATTYHQLGIIAEKRRDFAAAEKWYQKSLEIKEKLGNEHGAATTYHQLGIIAEERRDFAAAEKWYQKSLEINEKLGNEHGAASTYGQLGLMASVQRRFEDAGQWLLKCLQVFINARDPARVQQTASNFMVIYKQAPPPDQAKMRSLWESTGLSWPEDESRAGS